MRCQNCGENNWEDGRCIVCGMPQPEWPSASAPLEPPGGGAGPGVTNNADRKIAEQKEVPVVGALRGRGLGSAKDAKPDAEPGASDWSPAPPTTPPPTGEVRGTLISTPKKRVWGKTILIVAFLIVAGVIGKQMLGSAAREIPQSSSSVSTVRPTATQNARRSQPTTEPRAGALLTLLPDDDASVWPFYLVPGNRQERTLQEVAGYYRNAASVREQYTDWGWRGNAIVSFGVSPGESVSAWQINGVYVSVQQFANTAGARGAFDLMTGEYRAALKGVSETSCTSGSSCIVLAGDDGGQNETISLAQVGAYTVFVSAESYAGDPGPVSESVLRATVERIQSVASEVPAVATLGLYRPSHIVRAERMVKRRDSDPIISKVGRIRDDAMSDVWR